MHCYNIYSLTLYYKNKKCSKNTNLKVNKYSMYLNKFLNFTIRCVSYGIKCTNMYLLYSLKK